MAKNKKKKNASQPVKKENLVASNEATQSTSKKQAQKAERLKKAKRKKIKRIIIASVIVLAIIAITLAIVFIVKSCNEKPKPKYNDIEFASVEIENYGIITVQLDKKNAPATVNTFKSLAKAGKYKGLEFTGVKNGCLYTNTNQNWGSIIGEFQAYNNHKNDLSHTQGVLSMHREADPNSGNGTFFITLEDKSAELDKYYAGFGKIVIGYDIIEQINADASEQGKDYVYPKIGEIEFYTMTSVIE